MTFAANLVSRADAFIHTGFYRPNLTLLVTPCRLNEQSELLLDRLKDRPRGPTIVYVTLQRTAETVADTLTRKGFPARAYHAGLPNEERDDRSGLVHEIFGCDCCRNDRIRHGD